MIKTFRNIIVFFTALMLVLGFSFSIKKINVINNSKNTENEIIEQIFPSKLSRNSLFCYLTHSLFKNKNILFIDDYEIEFVNPVEINLILKEKDNYFYYSYLRINYYVNNDHMINEIRDEVHEYVPEVVNAYEMKRNKGDVVKEIGGMSVDDLILMGKTIKELKVDFPSIDIDKKDDIVFKLGNVNVRIGDTSFLELKMKRLKETFNHVREMRGELDLTTVKDKMKNERYIFKKA